MTRANALALIAVLTALAGGLAVPFGFSGLIVAGGAGLLAAFGMYITDPRRKLDYPTLASHYGDSETGTGERRWIWRFVVVAYALALVGLGYALSARSVQAEEPTERFEPTECWFYSSETRPTRCGYLIVPERRDRPNGGEISLPVVILERSSENTRHSPIVYLNGGPGYPTYLDSGWQINNWLQIAEGLAPGRDLVLFDQRGIGMSEPWLGCPQLSDPRVWAGLTDRPGVEKDHVLIWRNSVTACRDRLLADGNDLGAYNSRESAADVAALGRVLARSGGQKITLYGSSYGTLLALTVMRDHAEIVESAILDAVLPLQANRLREGPAYFDSALSAVFRDCSANSDCARAYPDLRASLESALSQLQRNSIELELNQSNHFPSIELERPLYAQIDSFGLLEILRWILYDPDNVPHVPLLIHGLGRGEFWRLKFYAEGFLLDPYLADAADGMTFSVNCHEEYNFESVEAIAEADHRYTIYRDWALLTWDYNICDIWPSGQAAAVENDPVHSDIPTLLLAGAYDPVTPPVLARKAAVTLPNGHVFSFPGEGHGVTITNPCANDVVKQFLDNPMVRPQPACLGTLKPRDFLALGGGRNPDGAKPTGDLAPGFGFGASGR